jgi:hypothetical protein
MQRARRARHKAARESRSERRSRIALARAREAGEPQLCRELGRDDAAQPEPVLQSVVLVVDLAQHADLALEHRAFVDDAHASSGRKVVGDSARADIVHREPMAEQREVRAQHVFLEAGELREPEREAAVVAEIAEIAQVIGDALALRAPARAATMPVPEADASVIASSACE